MTLFYGNLPPAPLLYVGSLRSRPYLLVYIIKLSLLSWIEHYVWQGTWQMLHTMVSFGLDIVCDTRSYISAYYSAPYVINYTLLD
jgi:hypothetical protein